MEPIFLEIIFILDDLLADGFEDRLEIEDELGAALGESGVGEIVGGGAGMGEANIDVEIDLNTNFEDALAFLRKTLRRLRAPRTSVIIRHRPHEEVFPVY
jgi:hypothetical protein